MTATRLISQHTSLSSNMPTTSSLYRIVPPVILHMFPTLSSLGRTPPSPHHYFSFKRAQASPHASHTSRTCTGSASRLHTSPSNMHRLRLALHILLLQSCTGFASPFTPNTHRLRLCCSQNTFLIATNRLCLTPLSSSMHRLRLMMLLPKHAKALASQLSHTYWHITS